MARTRDATKLVRGLAILTVNYQAPAQGRRSPFEDQPIPALTDCVTPWAR
jgi:hypothetical protein